jgi:hypothetical protein
MTTAMILNAVFAVLVFTAVIGAIAWSIATQHRDRRPTRLETALRPRRWVSVRVRAPRTRYRGGQAYEAS